MDLVYSIAIEIQSYRDRITKPDTLEHLQSRVRQLRPEASVDDVWVIITMALARKPKDFLLPVVKSPHVRANLSIARVMVATMAYRYTSKGKNASYLPFMYDAMPVAGLELFNLAILIEQFCIPYFGVIAQVYMPQDIETFAKAVECTRKIHKFRLSDKMLAGLGEFLHEEAIDITNPVGPEGIKMCHIVYTNIEALIYLLHNVRIEAPEGAHYDHWINVFKLVQSMVAVSGIELNRSKFVSFDWEEAFEKYS
jgi:hypothetical protein